MEVCGTSDKIFATRGVQMLLVCHRNLPHLLDAGGRHAEGFMEAANEEVERKCRRVAVYFGNLLREAHHVELVACDSEGARIVVEVLSEIQGRCQYLVMA